MPATALPPAAAAVTTGYGIAWSVGPLAKTATLEFALPDSVLVQADATPAIYLGHGDEGWTRLGGTFDASLSPGSSGVCSQKDCRAVTC